MWRHILVQLSSIKFHENPLSISRIVAFGQTDMTKLLGVFLLFLITNASNNSYLQDLKCVPICFSRTRWSPSPCRCWILAPGYDPRPPPSINWGCSGRSTERRFYVINSTKRRWRRLRRRCVQNGLPCACWGQARATPETPRFRSPTLILKFCSFLGCERHGIRFLRNLWIILLGTFILVGLVKGNAWML